MERSGDPSLPAVIHHGGIRPRPSSGLILDLLSGRRKADAAFGGVQGVAPAREDEPGDQQNRLIGRPDVSDVDRGIVRLVGLIELGPVVGEKLNDFNDAGLSFGAVAGAR